MSPIIVGVGYGSQRPRDGWRHRSTPGRDRRCASTRRPVTKPPTTRWPFSAARGPPDGLRWVVSIDIGHNGPLNPIQFDDMKEALSDVEEVEVDVEAPRAWESTDNATLGMERDLPRMTTGESTAPATGSGSGTTVSIHGWRAARTLTVLIGAAIQALVDVVIAERPAVLAALALSRPGSARTRQEDQSLERALGPRPGGWSHALSCASHARSSWRSSP